MRLSLAFIAITLLLSSCAFSKKKSQAYFEIAQNHAPYDAIIVPGVPHDGVSWSQTMQVRVLWANYLYQKGMTKNIVFSGGAVYSQYSEAKIMAEYGKAMGIPAKNIFVDTMAEHSTENVYYSYRVAKEQGFSKIALATDPYQAKSLKGMIKKLELPIDLIPILFDTVQTLPHDEPQINPEIAIEDPFVPITERESFFTRLRGTMGQQIMWHEEDLPSPKKVKKMRRKGRLVE